jgi:hypothetical protein
MAIYLTPKSEALMRQKVANGNYASVGEAIDVAVVT